MALDIAAPPMRRAVPGFLVENAPPVVIVAAMAAVSLAWNEAVGLVWRPTLTMLLAGPAICFALAAVYATLRPKPAIAEASLYIGLWMVYPVFGTRLSYLGNALGYPLQDALLARSDAALGFRWIDWAQFVSAHPLLERVQACAYGSHFWQPLLSVVILSVWGPAGRNRELLTSLLLALLATLAVSTFLPAISPADTHGFVTPSGEVVRMLRQGGQPLTYVGIVCFPSFHTVMAVLFTLAHRGNRWSFPAFLALNAVMLSAIPYSGDHYLTDMIGGVIVAAGAFAAARRLLPSGRDTRRDAARA